MFVEWYRKRLFFSSWLAWFCSVGGLLGDYLGEDQFCFKFSNIRDLAKSFSHISITQPPHKVTNVTIFTASVDFPLCAAFWKLCTEDHLISWGSKNLNIVNSSGNWVHLAPSKTATGSLILSSEHYLMWWLKDAFKHIRTRIPICHKPSKTGYNIVRPQILSDMLISTLFN